jgi:predicted GNAT family acetyltransferase
VKTENDSAQRVYARLGFRLRRAMHLAVVQVAG